MNRIGQSGTMEQWKNGMMGPGTDGIMEEWKNVMMGRKRVLPKAILPIFQHSIIPVG